MLALSRDYGKRDVLPPEVCADATKVKKELGFGVFLLSRADRVVKHQTPDMLLRAD